MTTFSRHQNNSAAPWDTLPAGPSGEWLRSRLTQSVIADVFLTPPRRHRPDSSVRYIVRIVIVAVVIAANEGIDLL